MSAVGLLETGIRKIKFFCHSSNAITTLLAVKNLFQYLSLSLKSQLRKNILQKDGKMRYLRITTWNLLLLEASEIPNNSSWSDYNAKFRWNWNFLGNHLWSGNQFRHFFEPVLKAKQLCCGFCSWAVRSTFDLEWVWISVWNLKFLQFFR